MDAKTIRDMLAEPFDPKRIGWKPQSVKGNRALAAAYIDARDVEDRLDEVLGVGGWQDEYEILPEGSVVCRLRLKIEGEWVMKMDVGSPSDQPDSGDRMKAAFSDALKRTAVKFGIARYLYRLDAIWADYDPVKKCFSPTPQMPIWAMPRKQTAESQVKKNETEITAQSLNTKAAFGNAFMKTGASKADFVTKFNNKNGTTFTEQTLTWEAMTPEQRVWAAQWIVNELKLKQPQ